MRHVFYASANLGHEALTQSRNVWLVYFYAPPSDSGREGLLPLLLISSIIFAGRVIEAFDDVLIGWLSDRTSSRWGRRIPFIVAAVPPWALASVLIFVPPDGSTALIAIYVFVTLQVLQLSGTFVTAPWDALLPEIAPSSRQRLSISAWRVGFGTVGAALGLVVSGLLVDQLGFAWMALAMALIALTAQYVALGGIWGQARASRPGNALPLRAVLHAALANRSFRALILSFALFLSGLTLLIGLLPYYVSVVFGSEREGTWTAALTGSSIIALIAAIPFYLRLAGRTTKRLAYRRAMLLAVVLFPSFAFAGYLPWGAAEYQALLAAAIVGIPLAGVYLFPGPLVADVSDAEAFGAGARHEGVFFGAQVFVIKLAGALAPLLLGAILLLGRSAADPLGVRLVGPAAALLALAGLLAFRGYELPDEISVASSAVAEHIVA